MTELTGDGEPQKAIAIRVLNQIQSHAPGQEKDSNDDNGGQERNHFEKKLRSFLSSSCIDIFLKVL